MFLFSRFGFQRVGRFGCLLVRRCLRGWLVRRGRLLGCIVLLGFAGNWKLLRLVQMSRFVNLKHAA